MTEYRQFDTFEAEWTPREDEKFVLKPKFRHLVGQTFRLMYWGVFDEYRSLYAGEHEFLLHGGYNPGCPTPVFFSDRDLSNIRPINDE